MWRNSSNSSTDMSSGYISNTTSMNTSPKYASIGKVNPSGAKRTPSFVLQPRVPDNYAESSFVKPMNYPSTDNVMKRCDSRTSRSSDNSRPDRTSPRRIVRNRPHRNSVRKSKLVRSGDGRSSSKTVYRESPTNPASYQRKANNKNGHKNIERIPIKINTKNNREVDNFRDNVPPVKTKKVYLLSWNPRIKIKRVKSLQIKPMKNHRIPIVKEQQLSSANCDEYSQANPAAKNSDVLKSKKLTSESQLLQEPKKGYLKSSQGDLYINRDYKTSNTSNQNRNYSERLSPDTPRFNSSAKVTAPSESSIAPRPPVWQGGSQESITDMPELFALKKSKDSQSNLKKNLQYHRSLQHLPQVENHKRSLLGLIKRNFTMRFRDSRERDKCSKPREISKFEPKLSETSAKPEIVKSCEHLSSDRTSFDMIQPSPPKPMRQNRIKNRLDHIQRTGNGTATANERIFRKKQNEIYPGINRFRKENFHINLNNNTSVQMSKDDDALFKKSLEQPIQPILKDRRSISQPSLFFPYETDPAEEPFTHYANLPFQQPVRIKSSLNPEKDIGSGTAQYERVRNEFDEESRNELDEPSRYGFDDHLRNNFPNDARKTHTSDVQHCLAHKLESYPEKKVFGANWKSDANLHDKKWRGNADTCQKSGLSFSSFGPFDLNEILHKSIKEKDSKSAEQLENGPISRVLCKSDEAAPNMHHKHGNDQVPEGYIAVPSRGTVSEKFTNITNSHEENEDVREEQEVHHLGSYNHEDVQRAIRDGSDARALVRRRQSGLTDSSDHEGGHMVPLEHGERRVIHQAARTWRTVDKEDIHEKSHRDSMGELHTETTRTKHSEQFHNLQAPDADSAAEDGSEEEVRTSSKNRRHVRDVDMLEYYSMPKGSRLADGIKIGEGLRHVQENIEEDQEGDNLDGMSERMLEMRRQGIQSSRRAITKPPIEYHENEKARHSETNKWLENHFGSESGHSHSSTEKLSQRNGSGRGSSCGRDVPDRYHKVDACEYNPSNHGSNRPKNAQKHSHHEESYTRHIRETPQQVYIKETRQGPDGGFESVEVRPNGYSQHHYLKERNRHYTPNVEPFNSLKSDKSSKSYSRGNRGVHFENSSGEITRTRNSGEHAMEIPPSASPPPPPPPRHKKKNKEKQQSLERYRGDSNVCYASSPVVHSGGEDSSYQRSNRKTDDNTKSYRERQVLPNDENNENFSRNEETSRIMPRKNLSASSRYQHRDTPIRLSRGSSTNADSKLRPSYYLGEEPYGAIHNKSVSVDQLQTASSDHSQYAQIENHNRVDRERGRIFHNQNAPRLSGAHSRLYRDRNTTGNNYETVYSQTMPRKVNDRAYVGRVTSGSNRFGGSMVNVSGSHNNQVHKSAKPSSYPVQRSNSMYLQTKSDKIDMGLKSPDIISKIQRSASMKKVHDEADFNKSRNFRDLQSGEGVKFNPHVKSFNGDKIQSSRKTPPQLYPKPNTDTNSRGNFMKGLMRKAPELFGVLHGNERKDSKTPSPKHSPPSSYYNRGRSPTLPLGIDRDVFPKTPPVFKRIEHLRADEEVATKNDSKFPHSTTEIRDYTPPKASEPPRLTRYRYNEDLYTAPSGRRTPSDSSKPRHDTHHIRPKHTNHQYTDYRPRQEDGAVVIEVRNWDSR